MHLPCERERVEHAAERRACRPCPDFLREPRELRVEERDVERRVVDDQLRVGDELAQLLEDLGKARLPAQEFARESMHLQRARVDLTVGTKVAVELSPRPAAIDDLDRTDFDDPVPEFRLEARGLGVEDDLAHGGEVSAVSV